MGNTLIHENVVPSAKECGIGTGSVYEYNLLTAASLLQN